MSAWWLSLDSLRKGLVSAGAIAIALVSALWLTASGLGDPELCYEVPNSGTCGTCEGPPEPATKAD